MNPPRQGILSRAAIHLRWRLDQFRRRKLSRELTTHWRGRRKMVSAMIRVRDSEEFLLPSILSIIDLVDEVVVVDNMSRDSAPEIIRSLAARFPDRVKSFYYPHDCVRVGEDFLALHTSDPESPRLGTVHANWCIDHCTHPFILKWDHDMIALDTFAGTMEAFRHGNSLTWEFGGHNLSADRKNPLTWTAGIEMRVFPKHTTRFLWSAEASAGGYDGPSADTGVSRDSALVTEEALYAHMKYCMRDPGRIQSPEFRRRLEARIGIGAPVPEEVGRAVEHWLGQSDTFFSAPLPS